eukprot:TRINITY_DN57587_c0_g1_i2.p1 TRINITY_DN57587_c0_g1~~TRINITY_DN57587_c0_g1_i2.p1  ORF type:complete len:272 (-),score=67.34 TRINITY_DN57587_c0_g1_i2:54-869(-)
MCIRDRSEAAGDSSSEFEARWCHPPEEWRPLVESAVLMPLLFKAHKQLRSSELLSRQIRLALLQLASMQGNVFRSDPDRLGMLSQLLQGVLLSLSSLPADAAEPSAEQLDLCIIVSRIITAAKRAGIMATPQLQASLTEVCNLTAHVLTGPGLVDEQPWSRLEAFDALLDSWVMICTERSPPGMSNSSGIAPAAQKVFQHYVRFTMLQSRHPESTLQDCYKDDLTADRLTAMACIARTCLLYTSDAADEEDSVDLGGRRIIKKKKRDKIEG